MPQTESDAHPHALPVVVGRDLAQPNAFRERDVVHEVGAAPDQHDLGVVGDEARRHQPLGKVGRLVVAVGLPLDHLAACDEELDLPADPVVRVVPQALGALDHGAVRTGIRRVGAVHRHVAVDDEARRSVAVVQPHLGVEQVEQGSGIRVVGHGPFHASEAARHHRIREHPLARSTCWSMWGRAGVPAVTYWSMWGQASTTCRRR